MISLSSSLNTTKNQFTFQDFVELIHGSPLKKQKVNHESILREKHSSNRLDV